MLNLAIDSAALLLLTIVVCHAGFLHMRITRLRRALVEAADVLPSVDAAMARLGEATGGFARRVQADLESVDTRLTGARRTVAELAAASRSAEELASQLDRQVRQARRLEGARAAAIPRELAEPKGFAERVGAPALEAPRPEPALSGLSAITPAPVPVPASAPAAVAERPGRLVRMNML
jgi:hypothetical protein